ncbi:MAG: type II secretion system F family protein [Vulcanimicrobiaceae bacterium]
MVTWGIAALVVAVVGFVAYMNWDKFIQLIAPLTEPYRELLERGGIRWRTDEIALRIVAIAIPLWAAFMYFGKPPSVVGVIAAPAILIGTFYGFGVWVRNKIKNRLEKFNGQLEVALRLMATGLRVGLGLRQSLIVVVSEMPDPLRSEFNRVLGQTSIGVSIYDALDQLGERMPGSEMLMMTRAIRIQSQTGGNLGRVLDTLAETITQRRRIDRKVRALTSEARASSLVITILPLFVAGFILATQPTLRDALIGTTFGRLVMLLVAGLLFVGNYVMRSMAVVDV